MKTKLILGIIATLFGGIFIFSSIALSHSSRKKSLRVRYSQTQGRLHQLQRSLDDFKKDTGFYPPTENELSHLLSDHNIKNWRGPYYDRKVLHTDSWGIAFHYELRDESPVLISAGRDGKFGTSDDIKLEK